MTIDAVVQTIQSFIHTYGLLAVFVYLALETGLILHFAPSELIVPFAAAELVHSPLSFAVFVLVATAGATVGALFPYAIFRRYGRVGLDRYGRYIHVSSDDVDRGERWFRQWGESSVLWGRVLPVVRAYIAIPAGLAEMTARRYTIYSAIGAAAYNTLIAYLVYTGESTGSPLHHLWVQATHRGVQYVAVTHASLLLGLSLGIVIAVLVGWGWWNRASIVAAPVRALQRVLFGLSILGLITSTGVILGGIVSPLPSYHLVTSVWDDARILVAYGASPQLTLLLIGGVGTLATGCLYLLYRLLSSLRTRVLLTRQLVHRMSP